MKKNPHLTMLITVLFLIPVIVNCQCPVVYAGDDDTICESGIPFPLAGAASDYSGLLWTTPGGDGFFDDENSLYTNYYPGPGDHANGSVELCLTGYPIDPCIIASTECMNLFFQVAPIADAGIDATINAKEWEHGAIVFTIATSWTPTVVVGGILELCVLTDLWGWWGNDWSSIAPPPNGQYPDPNFQNSVSTLSLNVTLPTLTVINYIDEGRSPAQYQVKLLEYLKAYNNAKGRYHTAILYPGTSAIQNMHEIAAYGFLDTA
ncbi:MAG: hypothetical protein B6I19_04865, partial [Bacteroidetes bacterium 4572_114]